MDREADTPGHLPGHLPGRLLVICAMLIAPAVLAPSMVRAEAQAQVPAPGQAPVQAPAPAPAPADPGAAATERGVKAAFLYKFASYVEWPESSFARPDTPLTFGVMGDETIAAELTRLAAGRSIDGRPLAVRRLKEGDPLGGLHVLFVSHAERARLEQVTRAAAVRPILIVTESEGALAQGSTINFVIADGRVKFAISTESADKRSLKLSSRLLTVAQNMRAGAP